MLEKWFLKTKLIVRQILFPLIIIQFVRTLFFPTIFDIIFLFIMFLLYIGFLLEYY
jgi:hypothetical protein